MKPWWSRRERRTAAGHERSCKYGNNKSQTPHDIYHPFALDVCQRRSHKSKVPYNDLFNAISSHAGSSNIGQHGISVKSWVTVDCCAVSQSAPSLSLQLRAFRGSTIPTPAQIKLHHCRPAAGDGAHNTKSIHTDVRVNRQARAQAVKLARICYRNVYIWVGRAETWPEAQWNKDHVEIDLIHPNHSQKPQKKTRRN